VVRSAQVRDAKLRDEALQTAKSVCLNIAERSGSVTWAVGSRDTATVAQADCLLAFEHICDPLAPFAGIGELAIRLYLNSVAGVGELQ
jgi:hypothetical protein